MKFNYIEIPSSDPTKPRARRPYVVIRLLCGSSLQDLWCLVDSGADVCLFRFSIGRLIHLADYKPQSVTAREAKRAYDRADRFLAAIKKALGKTV